MKISFVTIYKKLKKLVQESIKVIFVENKKDYKFHNSNVYLGIFDSLEDFLFYAYIGGCMV